MFYKFDHAHLGGVATTYRSQGYAALDTVAEQDIKMWEYNKRVFIALIREIYLATYKTAAISEANAFATAVVKTVGAAKLLAFMQEYVVNATFNAVINGCVAARSEDKTVAAINAYVADVKPLELFNDTAMIAYDESSKKAQLGVILNTLVPVLVQISKLKLASAAKTIFTRKIKETMADLNLTKKAGSYFMTDAEGNAIAGTEVATTFKAQEVLVAIASLVFVDKAFYADVVAQINGSNAGTAAQKFNTAIAVYSDLSSANNTVGLQALVAPACAVDFA